MAKQLRGRATEPEPTNKTGPGNRKRQTAYSVPFTWVSLTPSPNTLPRIEATSAALLSPASPPSGVTGAETGAAPSEAGTGSVAEEAEDVGAGAGTEAGAIGADAQGTLGGAGIDDVDGAMGAAGASGAVGAGAAGADCSVGMSKGGRSSSP